MSSDSISIEALKSSTEKAFYKALGNKVVITINEDLISLDVAKNHLYELLSTVREYNLKQGELTEIILGYIPSDANECGSTKYDLFINSKQIFLSNTIDYRSSINAFGNSRCDESRLPFSLASHEGGHLLFSFNNFISGDLKPFKQNVEVLWNEYKREFSELSTIEKTLQRGEIFIGTYGHNTINEFIAECFQEYRNSRNPSKYALRLGKLIDAYFKR